MVILIRVSWKRFLVLCVFLSLILISSGAMSLTQRIGTQGSDVWSGGDEENVRNSNGKVFAKTATGVQLAIWDLNGTGGTVYIPEGTYTLTNTIDCTNFNPSAGGSRNQALDLICSRETFFQCGAGMAGKPMFDFTNSSYCYMERGWIHGTTGILPSCGILIARDNPSRSAGWHLFNGVMINNGFTNASVFILGSEVNTFQHCLISNNLEDGYCVVITGNNANWSITSPWSTPVGGSMTQIEFEGGDMQYNGGGWNGSCVFIGHSEVEDIRFNGMFFASDGLATIEFEHNNHLNGPYTFVGCRAEGVSNYSIYANMTGSDKDLSRVYMLSYNNRQTVDFLRVDTGNLRYLHLFNINDVSTNGEIYVERDMEYCFMSNYGGIDSIEAGRHIQRSDLCIADTDNVVVGSKYGSGNTNGCVIRSLLDTTDGTQTIRYNYGTSMLLNVNHWGVGAGKTISDGNISITQTLMNVDTEGGGVTDDLNNVSGGRGGDIIILQPRHDTHTVVVKHGTGENNTELCNGVDFVMDDETDMLMLVFDSNRDNWVELCRNDDNGLTVPTSAPSSAVDGSIWLITGNQTLAVNYSGVTYYYEHT